MNKAYIVQGFVTGAGVLTESTYTKLLDAQVAGFDMLRDGHADVVKIFEHREGLSEDLLMTLNMASVSFDDTPAQPEPEDTFSEVHEDAIFDWEDRFTAGDWHGSAW